MLNDFEAVGYGIPALPSTDLIALNDVKPVAKVWEWNECLSAIIVLGNELSYGEKRNMHCCCKAVSIEQG